MRPHFLVGGCGSQQVFLISGISLLWRKVLEAQESENIFLRSCTENSLLQGTRTFSGWGPGDVTVHNVAGPRSCYHAVVLGPSHVTVHSAAVTMSCYLAVCTIFEIVD